MTIPPLNGTKTRALSPHALGRLRSIGQTPIPCQEVNPGVGNRLMREALVEVVQLPSPYRIHKGATLSHYKITPAGMAVVAEKSKP